MGLTLRTDKSRDLRGGRGRNKSVVVVVVDFFFLLAFGVIVVARGNVLYSKQELSVTESRCITRKLTVHSTSSDQPIYDQINQMNGYGGDDGAASQNRRWDVVGVEQGPRSVSDMGITVGVASRGDGGRSQRSSRRRGRSGRVDDGWSLARCTRALLLQVPLDLMLLGDLCEQA